jgi:hypothetical protein
MSLPVQPVPATCRSRLVCSLETDPHVSDLARGRECPLEVR